MKYFHNFYKLGQKSLNKKQSWKKAHSAFVRRNCSSDGERILKFRAESWEFAKILITRKFVRTNVWFIWLCFFPLNKEALVGGNQNFWTLMNGFFQELLLTVSIFGLFGATFCKCKMKPWEIEKRQKKIELSRANWVTFRHS